MSKHALTNAEISAMHQKLQKASQFELFELGSSLCGDPPPAVNETNEARMIAIRHLCDALEELLLSLLAAPEGRRTCITNACRSTYSAILALEHDIETTPQLRA